MRGRKAGTICFNTAFMIAVFKRMACGTIRFIVSATSLFAQQGLLKHD
jgi:hypothetical protein